MEAKDTGKYIHNHNSLTYPCKACAHSEGYKAGIKEVVDWLINDSYDTTIHFGDDWEAKLKDWGINEIRG